MLHPKTGQAQQWPYKAKSQHQAVQKISLHQGIQKNAP
nr:MAG TPA: hypothetical protein [Siphoviridae sp. ctedi74]